LETFGYLQERETFRAVFHLSVSREIGAPRKTTLSTMLAVKKG
jgi:hypothetical protein